MSSPIRFSGLTSGMDTQSMVQQLMRAESMRMTRLTSRRQIAAWRREDLRNTQSTLLDFRNNRTDFASVRNRAGDLNINYERNWNTMSSTATRVGGPDMGSISVTANSDARAGAFTIEVGQAAQRATVRGATQFRGAAVGTTGMPEINLDSSVGALVGLRYTPGTLTGTISINGTDINVGVTDSVRDVMNRVNNSDAGVTMAFDALRGVFTLTQNATGSDAQIETSGTDLGADLLLFMGLYGVSTDADPANNVDPQGYLVGADPNRFVTAFVQSGRFAAIYVDGTSVDGARMEQEGNVFEFEGIRIDISAASAGQVFNIETSQNVDAVMDMIRDFVEQYNNLIRELNSIHSTSRPTQRGNRNFFEPLTDEQRQAMSEREIENWEEQARTGLLHRDSQLRHLHNQIRQAMFEPVNLADGTQMFLFNAGITTVGINGAREDRLIGVLEIDERRLREALEEDPERVRALFTQNSTEVVEGGMPGGTPARHRERSQHVGVVNRLRDILHDTVEYPDNIFRQRVGAAGWDDGQNILGRQIADYDQRISRMEQFLIRRENHFFAMFARMEAAMAQSHAQMDALFAFGGQ